MAKEIKLTQGKVAVVDDADYEWLNQWSWQAQLHRGKWYAERKQWLPRKKIYMHALIVATPSGMKTDHIDGDGLNNQRENLRVCTNTQNAQNRRANSNNTSGYKGVGWRADRNKWRAYIEVGGTLRHLGFFKNAEDAARAYDEAARLYHGEFAQTNFK